MTAPRDTAAPSLTGDASSRRSRTSPGRLVRHALLVAIVCVVCVGSAAAWATDPTSGAEPRSFADAQPAPIAVDTPGTARPPREAFIANEIDRAMRRANLLEHRNRLQLELDAVMAEFGVGYARRVARRIDVGASVQFDSFRYVPRTALDGPLNDGRGGAPDGTFDASSIDWLALRVDALNLIPGTTFTLARAGAFCLDMVVRVTARREWIRDAARDPAAWFVAPQVAIATTARGRTGFYLSMLGGGGPTWLVAQNQAFAALEGERATSARGGFYEFHLGWAW